MDKLSDIDKLVEKLSNQDISPSIRVGEMLEEVNALFGQEINQSGLSKYEIKRLIVDHGQWGGYTTISKMRTIRAVVKRTGAGVYWAKGVVDNYITEHELKLVK